MNPSVLEGSRKILAGASILIVIFTFPARSQALSEALLCINTMHSPMAVQQVGQGAIPITGTITSLNPVTGEVGLLVEGSTGEQYIKPKSIRLGVGTPNLGAPDLEMQQSLNIQQMPAKVVNPLGPLRRDFSLAELSVDQGIIRYPNCVMAQPSQQITFTGTLTFEGGSMKVDGTFFEYGFASPGYGSPPAGPTGPGVSSGKRG